MHHAASALVTWCSNVNRTVGHTHHRLASGRPESADGFNGNEQGLYRKTKEKKRSVPSKRWNVGRRPPPPSSIFFSVFFFFISTSVWRICVLENFWKSWAWLQDLPRQLCYVVGLFCWWQVDSNDAGIPEPRGQFLLQTKTTSILLFSHSTTPKA